MDAGAEVALDIGCRMGNVRQRGARVEVLGRKVRNTISGLILGVSLLSGCASVAMVDPQRDAAAKSFVAPAGMGGIYIYRNELLGAAIKMDVAIDGVTIGRTGANTYLYKEVTPGRHLISSAAENTSSLNVDVQAGALYYVWQEVKMGFLSARNKLHLVGEEEGKAAVLETNMAETK